MHEVTRCKQACRVARGERLDSNLKFEPHQGAIFF